MLEKVALITIILSGIVYITKNVINPIKEMIYRRNMRLAMREDSKQLQKMMEDLSSVPTEIKKPRTKKKGK